MQNMDNHVGFSSLFEWRRYLKDEKIERDQNFVVLCSHFIIMKFAILSDPQVKYLRAKDSLLPSCFVVFNI